IDASNDDVVNDAYQPQNDLAPKHNWFTRPPRLPTLDPEWNKGKEVDDSQEHTWFNDLLSTEKSSIELEYNMEECYKALSDQLDWNNLEGDRCPFDLTEKTFSLKFISREEVYFVNYKDKGCKIRVSGYQRHDHELMKFLKHDVYSHQKIMSLKSVKVNKLHGYGYLEEIMVRRADRQLYKFKEGDFKSYHQKKIQDVQLGVESYQRKLNITKPHKEFPGISVKELYTPLFDPPGVVYEDLNKQKRVMWADELYKFSDGTLKLNSNYSPLTKALEAKVMVAIVGEEVPWPEEVEVDLPSVRLIRMMVKECLEGCVGVGGGEVNGGGDDFGVSKSLLGEIPGVVIGESGGEIFGDDGGAVW
ncbi:hypothetical protein Tco_1074836, partial [Tanacetum coccineum]